ncbi:DgyrCDS6579 [Dimorphilus gyrociliatus]|uniref:Eukaryotic translation initiation factor 3 subunit F n=1 Tax=Dimorphilus gyrociliatus TaxID=2664684 RepID=A0A7I8VR72_9ANNE|nr:DgyrCDS6579 [Dimorphilus gyrociliatus]
MASALEVKVHPLVLFNIVDSYERRSEDPKRVIGTLLGIVDKNVVEITNCFTVPHNESADEVAVDIEYAKGMFDLYKRVTPWETVVGWYSTGNEVTAHSRLIHEYYSLECKQPIHITVDTSLKNNRMNIQGYIGSAVGISGKAQGVIFTPLDIDIVAQDAERVAFHTISQAKSLPRKVVSVRSDMEQVAKASEQIETMLEKVEDYVDKVTKKELEANPKVGRSLLELINSVPKLSAEEFDTIVNSNMKDLLMVVYLANLTKTQLMLKEKLIHCLYEDQVGKFDWRQQYIGKVQFAAFNQAGQFGKKVIVGSEENVIAALTVKNGELSWRQILENDDRLDTVLHLETAVVAISGGGKFVRAFTINQGFLLWEVNLQSEPEGTATGVIYGGRSEKVAVLANNRVWSVDTSTGRVQWTKTLTPLKSKFQKLINTDSSVTVLRIPSSGDTDVISYSTDGSRVAENTIKNPWMKTDSLECITVTTNVVCLESEKSRLYLLNAAKPHSYKEIVLSASTCSKNLNALFETRESLGSLFGFKKSSGSGMALIKIDGDKTKELFYSDNIVATSITKLNNELIIATATVENQEIKIRFFEYETGNEITSLQMSDIWPSYRKYPNELRVLAFKKKDGTTSVRVFIISDDLSLSMFIKNGGITWTREEALSNILSVEMVDLPVSQIQAEMEDEFGSSGYNLASMFVKRLITQLHQFGTWILHISAKLSKTSGSNSGRAELINDPDYLTRDDFNLHKMIVATTASMKLFGIDNLSGQILWQISITNAEVFDHSGKIALPLYIQRTTAHFPHPPVATVVARHATKAQSIFMTFNPITGEIQGSNDGVLMNYVPIQITQLQFVQEDYIAPLVIIDSSKMVHVYPTEGKNVVKEHANNLFTYTVDTTTNILNGYVIMQEDSYLVAAPSWRVDLMKNEQNITNIVAKRSIGTNYYLRYQEIPFSYMFTVSFLEHVHSQGVVLGDRSVMYKYLNPNLFAVTTSGVDQQGKSFISVYLIDGVTGNVVYSTTHKSALGPVQIVHSENWIAYVYYSVKNRQKRSEVAVVEIFEGKEQNNATAFSSFSVNYQPMFMTQAYIFSGHVSAMAVTVTEKGITNKEVIMALPTGSILALPKMLLDPRRPLVPTAESQEEGVLPYIPELPKLFEAMVNYNQSVYRVKGIHTAPAGLESTSLVLTYGLDLFYTRLMPSKMYDVLKEDFDYFFISAVVTGMIVVSVVTQKFSSRKALSRAWK